MKETTEEINKNKVIQKDLQFQPDALGSSQAMTESQQTTGLMQGFKKYRHSSLGAQDSVIILNNS